MNISIQVKSTVKHGVTTKTLQIKSKLKYRHSFFKYYFHCHNIIAYLSSDLCLIKHHIHRRHNHHSNNAKQSYNSPFHFSFWSATLFSNLNPVSFSEPPAMPRAKLVNSIRNIGQNTPYSHANLIVQKHILLFPQMRSFRHISACFN